MLRSRSLSTLLAAGVFATAGTAQPPAASPSGEFAALVAQLAADDFQVRERAGAALLKAGESAIPDLKAALAKAGEPEATRRLAVLVERLESARLGEPRRVTLKVERKAAKEVFAELARQTGYKFTFNANGNGNGNSAIDKALVTFDWRGTPFLQALDGLCDALQVNSNVTDPGGEVNVFEGDQVNPHVAYAGPFRLVVTNVNSNRNVQVGGLSRRNPLARQPDYVNLNFMVHGEPKACLCAIGQPTALRATDELKNSLALGVAPQSDDTPPDASAEVPVPTFRSHTGSASLTLARVARQAEFVKDCRVKMSVAVLAETRPEIVVLDAAKGQGRKYTGRTHLLQVGAAGAQGNTATVDVTVSRKHADTDDYSWMSTMQQRFEAFDAEGKPLQSASVNQMNNGPNAVTLSLSFTRPSGQKPPVIARLHLVEWVVQHKTVEFTLKDIPLP